MFLGNSSFLRNVHWVPWGLLLPEILQQYQQKACFCELVSALALFLELKKRWSVKGFEKTFLR